MGKRDRSMIRTCLFLATLVASSVSGAPGEGALRAGAARVDITPPEGAALRMSGYAGRLSGAPIAVIMNHGVHCTVFGAKNLRISGDLAGAASRYVEQRLGGAAVAVFTSGAAGDQAPIYNRAESYEDVAKLGRILGDEVLRVSAKLRMSALGRIAGAQTAVTCPGQKRVAGSQKDPAAYRFEDAAPVTIRLSLLMINHIALTGVSGEVLTMIARRLKKESPLSRTLMVTNCNGSSSYIPDDAAYDEVSYEIASAHVKRGCAENAIVNGLLDMIDKAAAQR